MVSCAVLALVAQSPYLPPQVREVLAFGMTRIASPVLDADVIEAYRAGRYEVRTSTSYETTHFDITFPNQERCRVSLHPPGIITRLEWPWSTRSELEGEFPLSRHLPIPPEEVRKARELITLCGIQTDPAENGIKGEDEELLGRREWTQFRVWFRGAPALRPVILGWNSGRITDLSIPGLIHTWHDSGWNNLPPRTVTDEEALKAAVPKAIAAFGEGGYVLRVGRFGYASGLELFERDESIPYTRGVFGWILVPVVSWNGHSWFEVGAVGVNAATGVASHHYDARKFAFTHGDVSGFDGYAFELAQRFELDVNVVITRPSGRVVVVNLTSYAISAIENERGVWVPVTGGWQRAVPR